MSDLFARFAEQELQLCVSHRKVAHDPVEAITALGSNYLWSPKLDGNRALAVYDGGSVQLRSRNGSDLTTEYPEIVEALMELPHPMVLDAELVHVTADNRFAPWAVSARSNSTYRRSASVITPVVLMTFDVLWSNWDLRKQPLTERLKHLNSIEFSSNLIQVVPSFDDGLALWQRVQELGLEGLVGKRRNGKYLPGRTAAWIKVKQRDRVSVIVGSILPSEHRALGKFEAFALDATGELVDLGQVGTGFSERELQHLANLVAHYAQDPVNRSPVIVDVEMDGLFPNGLLKFPSYIGLRTDIDFEACTTTQEGLR